MREDSDDVERGVKNKDDKREDAGEEDESMGLAAGKQVQHSGGEGGLCCR